MSTQTENDFNNSAENKVIEFSELTGKLEKLTKTGLSRTEKIYFSTVDHISTFLASVALALDSNAGRAPVRLWRAPDKKTTYVGAETIMEHKKRHIKYAFNKRIAEKKWALGEQALAECQDYQGTAALSKAKQVY